MKKQAACCLSFRLGVVTSLQKVLQGTRLRCSIASVSQANESTSEKMDWLAKQRYGFWRDWENRKLLLASIGSELGIVELSDWYKHSRQEVIKRGGWRLFKIHASLEEALRTYYPDYPWEAAKFLQNNRRLLNKSYWKEGGNVTRALDLVEEKLGIRTAEDWYTVNISELKELGLPAKLKRSHLADWLAERYPNHPWDRTALLKSKQQGELKKTVASSPSREIMGIGQPMTPSFFTQIRSDTKGWWMFEKYGGVRAFWNPSERVFYSKQGTMLFGIPQHIIDDMPTNMFLDGEFWFGHKTKRLTKSDIDSNLVNWNNFKYMAFDVPTHKGNYRDRYRDMAECIVKKHCKYVEVAPHEECGDMTHFENYFQSILDRGGEGIALRDPSSHWQPGRSVGYQTSKRLKEAEAKIGSKWECELPNGVRFTAPACSMEFIKRWQPQPGDVVSFKHSGFFLGSRKPKLPFLYKIKRDKTWQDIVNSWKETKAPVVRSTKKKTKAKGYWRDPTNRRNALTSIAIELGQDPSDVSTWANPDVRRIIKKRCKGLLTFFNSSMYNMLKTTFPELDIQPSETKSKWRDVNRLREFFDKIAEGNGFNSADVNAWLTFDRSIVKANKDVKVIKRIYVTWQKALKAAYPDLAFEKKEEEKDWTDPTQCRIFFDEFAKARGLNPLDTQQWYSLQLSTLNQLPGGKQIKQQHKGFKNALCFAYPELQFTRWQQLQTTQK